MIQRLLFFLVIFLLSFPFYSIAQKQLSADETQNFYRLIKQTKEYKIVKQQTDSINEAQDEKQAPQEIDMKILIKDQTASDDDHIFDCTLERRLAIGIAIDRYDFQYDKQKKQIVSIRHVKARFQIN